MRFFRFFDRLWTIMLAFVSVVYIASNVRQAVDAEELVNAQGLYTQAWREVRNLYVDLSFNGQDWDKWEHKFDGELHTPSDAYQAIQFMLASLNDPWTRIARPGKTQPEKDSATASAATPRVEPVTAKLLEDNIGYIKIATFSSPDCARQVGNSLKQFRTAKGLIMDLRGNRGGLVVNALQIADMLLKDGNIVTTVTREGPKTFTASGDPLTDQPLVVLVDANSASASEILTGALKENKRATIIGSKTFGKGLVQEVRALPGEFVLYVTSAHYLTPSGSDINKVGIHPHVQKHEREEIDLARDCLKGTAPPNEVAESHDPNPAS